MKKSGLVLIVLLVILIAVGWISQLTGAVGKEQERSSYLKQAAQYFEQELYQKAIECYNGALGLKESLKTRVGWLQAYKEAYLDEAISLAEYTGALSEMCARYPDEVGNWEELLSIYVEQGDMNSAYDSYKDCDEAGATSEVIRDFANKILYSYNVTGRSCTDYIYNTNGSFTVFDGERWGVLDASGSTSYGYDYDYISPYGENGYALFTTEKGQRLMDKEGVIQAKIATKLEKTGAYSQGLLPICTENGQWSYLDCASDTVALGAYEDASNFTDGVAAVCKNGVWTLINTKGEAVCGTSFTDVKLHGNRDYFYDGVMIAAVNGVYGMYDANGKALHSFAAQDMDIYMGGDVAYCDSNGKWGYVSAKGTVTLEAQYDGAKSFSNGIAAVSNGETWGFIDTAGVLVIDYRFIDADYFTSVGTCMVSAADSQYNLLKLKFFNG